MRLYGHQKVELHRQQLDVVKKNEEEEAVHP